MKVGVEFWPWTSFGYLIPSTSLGGSGGLSPQKIYRIQDVIFYKDCFITQPDMEKKIWHIHSCSWNLKLFNLICNMHMLLTPPPPNTHKIFSPLIWTDHKTGNFEINGQKTGIPAKPERLSSLILGTCSRYNFQNSGCIFYIDCFITQSVMEIKIWHVNSCSRNLKLFNLVCNMSISLTPTTTSKHFLRFALITKPEILK